MFVFVGPFQLFLRRETYCWANEEEYKRTGNEKCEHLGRHNHLESCVSLIGLGVIEGQSRKWRG